MRRAIGMALVLVVLAACAAFAIIRSTPEVIGDPPLTKPEIAKLQALYDETRVAPPDIKNSCDACDDALEQRFKADRSLIELAIAFEARPREYGSAADRRLIERGDFCRLLLWMSLRDNDDALLVEILARVPFEDFGFFYLEYAVAGIDGFGGDISHVFDALDRCHAPEVRDTIIASIRRAFFRTIDHTLEDEAFVREARAWYATNRDGYKVNQAHQLASNDLWYGGSFGDWLPPPFFVPKDGPDQVEGEQLVPGSITYEPVRERNIHRWPRERTWRRVSGE